MLPTIGNKENESQKHFSKHYDGYTHGKFYKRQNELAMKESKSVVPWLRGRCG
jgi:hypothetical protein